MDKKGNICTSESEQAARWVQHFHEVLNLPEPEQLANITTTDDILETNSNPPDSVEVKVSIQSLKSGKACGIDAIYAEMLKADVLTSTLHLEQWHHPWRLFQRSYCQSPQERQH